MEQIIIDNILGGASMSDYFSGKGQFLNSIAIDPDMPATDSGNKPSGLIRPVSMAKFSGANVNAVPLWIISNPKDNKVYVLLSNGRFISYTSAFASETLIATVGTCSGNGMAYYDNAIYIARNTDIAKYHRMDSSPTLDDDYWTAVLSLSALTNKTYPSINGVAMPNHVMHRHTDDKLYVCDVLDTNIGCLHYIETTKGANEGSDDNGSDHDALNFDYGEYPVAIETYGTDLAIALIEGVDTAIKQKPAKISFWDTTSASYTKITSVEFPDPLISAIKNVNGVLYVFSGYATGGCRVSRFVGGYSFEEIAYLPDVYPPLQGAVDNILNKVVFGSNIAVPEIAPCIYSIGGKMSKGLQCIARGTGTGDDPMTTAVKYLEQTGTKLMPIIGGKDDSNYTIDKLTTTYGDHSVWSSGLFRIGNNFSSH